MMLKKSGFVWMKMSVAAVALLCCVMVQFAPASASGKISAESIDQLTRTGKAMAEIAGAVRPAIVNISTTRTMKVQGGADLFDDPFFRRFFGDNFNRNRQPRERKSQSASNSIQFVKK